MYSTCIHFHATIITVLVTHSSVWIVAGLVVFVLYSFSSLTFDALYISIRTMHHIACSNHFEISTVQLLSSFESMLLLNTEYVYTQY